MSMKVPGTSRHQAEFRLICLSDVETSMHVVPALCDERFFLNVLL